MGGVLHHPILWRILSLKIYLLIFIQEPRKALTEQKIKKKLKINITNKKKALINLILPRDLKESIPDYPYIYKWYRNDTNRIFYVGAGINKRA